MKKLKAISLSLALTMFLSVPAFAGTEMPSLSNTLSLEQVKKLAVENSRSAKDARIGLEYAEVKKDQVANQYLGVRDARREAAVRGNPAGKLVEATVGSIKNINAQIAATNPSKEPEKYALLQQQLALENSQLGVLTSLGGVDDLMAMEDKAETGKLQAEDAYNTTKNKVRDAEKIIEFSAESMYLQALQVEKMLDILNQKEQFMNKLLKVEKIKKEAGMTLDTNITTQAVSTSDSSKELRYWKDKHQTTLKVINDLIGRDLNAPLKLQEVNVRIKARDKYEEVLDQSIKNSGTIAEQKRLIERNQDDRGSVKSRSDEYSLYLKEEKRSNLAIEKVKIDNEVNVKNLFTDLSAKEKSYELAQVTLENSKKILEQNKLKFEVGMISKIELEQAELSFQSAVSDLQKASYDYYLVTRQIEMAKEGVFQ
ncbi:Outer membrane efflux protein [Desulfonispora thiosulfatigenes DSM 11270]|uniref:Outer membrane efflux protein n=1 Tax=Desulfonispora thiosulfatigenes DSM 11270 TaxID=656914 RepID=A0A1W1V5P2_DESTI|nr:TolC family protein [Desulfonispora thiosulfatigenes]SMB88304.1 Outer membrane efflux protein [Desulfonispora thiosulfatigenes DSM 11270]